MMPGGEFITDEYGNVIGIKENTDEALADLKTAITTALEKCGLAAERYAKRKCPVDTGRLRNSITHRTDSDKKEVVIGTNVEYAPYVELGTSRQKAQPFLEPAVHDHEDRYRKIFESELKKL